MKSLLNKAGNKYAEFCGNMLACRDIIHLCHWKSKGTGSYAEHSALGDLYDAMQDHADNITELIQSYKGIMDISVPGAKVTAPLPYLEKYRTELISMIETMESEMPDVSNKVQDMIGDISKTIYKLKNLS
jgi:DNA-binding ferritin-like protein